MYLCNAVNGRSVPMSETMLVGISSYINFKLAIDF